jgi:hypothetical protein
MNIFMILGIVFLVLVCGVICIVSLLPSPTINHLLRRYRKQQPPANGHV